jgi:hypothetical protein
MDGQGHLGGFVGNCVGWALARRDVEMEDVAWSDAVSVLFPVKCQVQAIMLVCMSLFCRGCDAGC